MRRRLLFPLLAFALLTSAIGLAPSPGTAAPAPSTADNSPPAAIATQRVNLRFGILPVTAFLGMYVAREWGWLEEEGINLDLVAMAGGAEILPAMIGGSLDAGITNTF